MCLFLLSYSLNKLKNHNQLFLNTNIFVFLWNFICSCVTRKISVATNCIVFENFELAYSTELPNNKIDSSIGIFKDFDVQWSQWCSQLRGATNFSPDLQIYENRTKECIKNGSFSYNHSLFSQFKHLTKK